MLLSQYHGRRPRLLQLVAVLATDKKTDALAISASQGIDPTDRDISGPSQFGANPSRQIF